MLDRIKILGFNITADFDTHTLTASAYETNKTVSQYEEVILEISTQDIVNPRAVRANFTLNDGTQVNNIYLAPVIGQANKFRVRLNEVIGNKLAVGENQTVNIGLRLTTDSSFAVLPDEATLSYRLYRTTLDTTYHPTDMDTLFVSLNKLNKEIAEVDARKLDAAGGTVVGDFTVTGKTTLKNATIEAGDISGVRITDSTFENNTVPTRGTLKINGSIDSKDGFVEVASPRADSNSDAANKGYVDITVKTNIDSNNIIIRNDLIGYETDSPESITTYGTRNYATELFNSLNSSAISEVNLTTNTATGQYILYFKKANGDSLPPIVIDTPDERIISNAYMDGNYLVLEFLGDVPAVRVNMTQFITIYTGDESNTVSVSVDSTNKVIHAEVKDGSITLAKLSTELQNVIDDIPNEELVRQQNEETRKSNEKARESAENIRISNENTRISNENVRKEKFAEWEKSINSFATKTELTDGLNTKANKEDLFSGNYDDLQNKPVIPTALSQLTNDSKFVSEASLATGLKTVNGNSLIGTGDIEVKATNVKANPEENATNELTKLKVDDNIYSVATVGYIDNKLKALIGTAPETLDTLGEIAKAINDNKDVVDAIQDSISTKADKTEVYTRAVIDEKLSAIQFDPETLKNFYNKSEINDKLLFKADAASVYTQTEIDNKLALKANANDVYTKTVLYTKDEMNELLAIKAATSTTLSGYGITDAYTSRQIDDKLDNKANVSSVPTKVSDLANDSGFITKDDIPAIPDVSTAIFRTWESVEV